jgi:hypothetical protein
MLLRFTKNAIKSRTSGVSKFTSYLVKGGG